MLDPPFCGLWKNQTSCQLISDFLEEETIAEVANYI